MSRFSHLEFGEPGRERPASAGPTDEARLLAEADAAFRRGEFELALRHFARVLEFNPHNASAWTGQIRMLLELDEPGEARLWADKALERFPREPDLLAAKAVALARDGDPDAALVFSDAAIEERGDSPYVWLARGDVLLARRERRADYCFDRALSAGRGDWLWSWLASRIHFCYQRFARALQLAKQALALDATQAVVWLQLGRCQTALGLPAAATLSLDHARQLNPQSYATGEAVQALRQQGLGARVRGTWRRWFSG